MIVLEKKYSGGVALYRVKYPLYKVCDALYKGKYQHSFYRVQTNLISVAYLNMYGEVQND